MDSSWEFVEGEDTDTAILKFEIDFDFRLPLYQKAVDLFLDEVVKVIVGSFEARARKLHGQGCVFLAQRFFPGVWAVYG